MKEHIKVAGSGRVRFLIYDENKNLVKEQKLDNTFTMDMSIVLAALMAGHPRPAVTMMAVGDGALGLSDAPSPATQTQRNLGNEIVRKAVSYSFIDPADSETVTSYPTKMVRYSATFSPGAIKINEIALVSAMSSSESSSSPNVLQPYDPDPNNFVYGDTDSYDLITNYLTFSPVNLQASWSLTLSWTVTFEVG